MKEGKNMRQNLAIAEERDVEECKIYEGPTKKYSTPSEELYYMITLVCDHCRHDKPLRLVCFSVGQRVRRRAHLCETCVKAAETVLMAFPFISPPNLEPVKFEDPSESL